MLKESIRKRILGPVHIHLDVTARFTNQIQTIYPIISTKSSIENYAKMRFESRRLSPYLFTCDVTHSLSVESHLQAFVLHFILSIKFAEKKKRKKKKEIKTEKDVICHRDLADAGPGVPGRVNLGSDTGFSSVVIPGRKLFLPRNVPYLLVFCCL